MTRKLLLVHGAGATPRSWAYFAEKIGADHEFLEYDATAPFSSILEKCRARAEESGAYGIVGHSFGGVVAWHVAASTGSIRKGVSVSSPWGGSRYADALEVMTLGTLPTSFFSNVRRQARHLVEPRTGTPPVPWLNVVTTRGTINTVEPNDGVVTVRSQRSLFRGPDDIEMTLRESHSEVLLTPDLPALVGWFVRD